MTKAPAKKRGRPSKFTEAIAAEICDRLSKGETLTSICRDEHMPEPRTVSDWKAAKPDFSTAFARAREAGFDAIAEECIEIAEDGSNDYTERRRQDGSTEEVFNAEHVQRSKLRIETRLKLLAKWDPKRYGEKLDLNHSGGVTIVAQDLDEQL